MLRRSNARRKHRHRLRNFFYRWNIRRPKSNPIVFRRKRLSFYYCASKKKKRERRRERKQKDIKFDQLIKQGKQEVQLQTERMLCYGMNLKKILDFVNIVR